MRKIGYARVSSTDQNLATQLEQLKKYGVDEIVQEKITGIAVNKKLNKLIESLVEGETLIVTRMDRLGRNTIQLLQLVEILSVRNVHLVILDMNIDTRTHTGKFFLTIMAGFSELERNVIKEKQRAGVELAKKAGKFKGRPVRFTDRNPKLQHAVQMYKDGKTVKEITNITGLGRSTLYRKLQEMRIDRGNL